MKKATSLFLVLIAIVSFAFIAPKNKAAKQITVVIDAGHGGTDHGATIDSFTEKAIVEQITNKIKSQNNDQEIVIHFTRNGDEFKTFDDRTQFINNIKPDLVLSLHVNSNKNTASSGIELYVSKENTAYEKSNAFAEKLNQKLVTNNNLKSSGIKEAKFLILRKSNVPAVLIELGYLSNPADRDYLTNDNKQNRIAATILEFISEMK